jgi:hypothetical protein
MCVCVCIYIYIYIYTYITVFTARYYAGMHTPRLVFWMPGVRSRNICSTPLPAWCCQPQIQNEITQSRVRTVVLWVRNGYCIYTGCNAIPLHFVLLAKSSVRWILFCFLFQCSNRLQCNFELYSVHEVRNVRIRTCTNIPSIHNFLSVCVL